MNNSTTPKGVLIIDAENVAGVAPARLQALVEPHCDIVETIAVGNFFNPKLKILREACALADITMIHVETFGRNGVSKNGADKVMRRQIKLWLRHTSIDVLVLVSGDGHHEGSIQLAKEWGRQTMLLAYPGSVSKRLRRQADEFISLDGNVSRFTGPNGLSHRDVELIQLISRLEEERPYVTPNIIATAALGTAEKGSQRSRLLRKLAGWCNKHLLQRYRAQDPRNSTQPRAVRLNRLHPAVQRARSG